MKKVTLLLLLPLVMTIGGCKIRKSSSSDYSSESSSSYEDNSSSDKESSSSGDYSSESSSSDGDSTSTSGEIITNELVDRLAYSLHKYNENVDSDYIYKEIGIKEKITLSDLFHILNIALNKKMPELIGARFYQGNFDTHKVTRTLSDIEYSDYLFLQSHGLIGEDYNPDQVLDLTMLNKYLNRIHAYIGTSEVDDFAYTVNHDWMYDNDNFVDIGPEDDKRDTNLVSQDAIGENAFELLKEAGKSEEYSNLNYLVDAYYDETILSPIDDKYTISEEINDYYTATNYATLMDLVKEEFTKGCISSLFSFNFNIQEAIYGPYGVVLLNGYDVDPSNLLYYLFEESDCDFDYFSDIYMEDLNDHLAKLEKTFSLGKTMIKEVKNSMLSFLKNASEELLSYYREGWVNSKVLVYDTIEDDPLYSGSDGQYSLVNIIEEAGIHQPAYAIGEFAYYFIDLIGDYIKNNADLAGVRAMLLFNYLSNYYNIFELLNKHDKYTYVRMSGYNLLSYYQTTERYDLAVTTTTELFDNLISSLKENAITNGWLSDNGVEALTKKANLVRHSLYGEYDGVDLPYKEYVSNDFTTDIVYDFFLYNKNIANLTSSWSNLAYKGEMKLNQQAQLFMEPFTPNAFYYPLTNSIYITMGYLFSKNDDFANYDLEKLLATFGLVMGHEITHGFDSNGCYFDGGGNFVSSTIFQPVDLYAFKDKQEQVIELYNREVITGCYQQGQVTLSEDLADIGGLGLILNIASKKENFDYKKFYYTLAANFMSKTTQFTYHKDLANDVHAFGGARLNPLMMARSEFNKTFNVQEWDAMYRDPSQEIIIW